jgi:dCTP deaminase
VGGNVTLLSHQELLDALREDDVEQRLVVMPMLDLATQVGSSSIDVRLGTQFRALRRTAESGIDPGKRAQSALVRGQQHITVAFGEPLWLHPGQFVLGSTLEFLRLPAHLGAYVLGRSSWGRIGLLVATAIMIQPGFSGSVTLELVNHGEGPIALYGGCRIAQLAVHSLNAPTDRAYSGKYTEGMGPEVSRLKGEQDDIAHLGEVAKRLEGRSS